MPPPTSSGPSSAKWTRRGAIAPADGHAPDPGAVAAPGAGVAAELDELFDHRRARHALALRGCDPQLLARYLDEAERLVVDRLGGAD